MKDINTNTNMKDSNTNTNMKDSNTNTNIYYLLNCHKTSLKKS